MKYFFCPSYEAIYFVLDYRFSGMEFIVITYNWSIKCFCDFLGLENIYFDYSYLTGRNTFHHFIQLYRLRKKLDEIVENRRLGAKDKFYLLGHIISWPGFYLARKISKKCQVLLKVVSGAIETNPLKEGRNPLLKDYWRASYLKWAVQLIFGVPLTIYDTGAKHVIGINDVFLKRYGIKRLKSEESIHDFRANVIKNAKPLVNKAYDTMLLYEASYLKSSMSKNTIQNLYKNITISHSNFVAKGHPDFKSENFEYLPSEVPKFSPYFPAELLFPNIRKYIIGIISASLVSVKYIPHLTAISVLELAKWKTPREKQYYKDFLIRQNDRILFPRSWDEFHNIIKGTK